MRVRPPETASSQVLCILAMLAHGEVQGSPASRKAAQLSAHTACRMHLEGLYILACLMPMRAWCLVYAQDKLDGEDATGQQPYRLPPPPSPYRSKLG